MYVGRVCVSLLLVVLPLLSFAADNPSPAPPVEGATPTPPQQEPLLSWTASRESLAAQFAVLRDRGDLDVSVPARFAQIKITIRIDKLTPMEAARRLADAAGYRLVELDGRWTVEPAPPPEAALQPVAQSRIYDCLGYAVHVRDGGLVSTSPYRYRVTPTPISPAVLPFRILSPAERFRYMDPLDRAWYMTDERLYNLAPRDPDWVDYLDTMNEAWENARR